MGAVDREVKAVRRNGEAEIETEKGGLAETDMQRAKIVDRDAGNLYLISYI